MLDTLDLMAHYQCHHSTILPEKIFENESPMLRRLSLKNISISWSAPVLHGLIYLHLEQDGRDRCPFSREHDFIYSLNGMPMLQTLYLENVLPAGSRADDQTARLPCLQNLTIIDGGHRCLKILPKFNISSSCRIGIHCVEFGSEDLELPDDILPLRLCEDFSVTPDPLYTLSHIHDSSKPCCGLKLWRKSNISDSSVLYLHHDPDLSLTIDRRWPEELLAVMFDTLPLNDIRVIIRRDYQYGLPGDDWINLYAHKCGEVSSILVNKAADAEELCEALGITLDDMTIPEKEAQYISATHRRFLFPNLRLLELQSVDVRPIMTLTNGIIALGDSIVEALNTRRTGGRPLSLVRLGTGCIIDAARLNALREIVDIEWDPESVQEIPKDRQGRLEGFVRVNHW